MIFIKNTAKSEEKVNRLKERIVSFLSNNGGYSIKQADLLKQFTVKSSRLPRTAYYTHVAIDELVNEGVVLKIPKLTRGKKQNFIKMSSSILTTSFGRRHSMKLIRILSNKDNNISDDQGGKIWFLSDLHFTRNSSGWVFNTYRKTKYSTPAIMNETIIREWNSAVGDNMGVILGDIGQKDYLRSMIGEKLLVEGNHDNGNNVDIIVFLYKGIRFLLVHDPKTLDILGDYSENPNTWIVHGHHHCGKFLNYSSHRINVNMDVIGARPVSLEHIHKTIISGSPSYVETCERGVVMESFNNREDWREKYHQNELQEVETIIKNRLIDLDKSGKSIRVDDLCHFGTCQNKKFKPTMVSDVIIGLYRSGFIRIYNIPEYGIVPFARIVNIEENQ